MEVNVATARGLLLRIGIERGGKGGMTSGAMYAHCSFSNSGHTIENASVSDFHSIMTTSAARWVFIPLIRHTYRNVHPKRILQKVSNITAKHTRDASNMNISTSRGYEGVRGRERTRKKEGYIDLKYDRARDRGMKEGTRRGGGLLQKVCINKDTICSTAQ